jgi:YD repeat-containing protein
MGRIISETDSNNLTTSFNYDALGRITQITPPGGEVPTYIDYP